MVAIHVSRMFNGSALVEDAVVITEGDRITRVSSEREYRASPETDELRLGEVTLIPGMIDCHVHFTGYLTADYRSEAFLPDALRAARCTRGLRQLLDAGFTTVRDCGGEIALGLKVAVSEGSVAGPRILAAGRFIERTGGADDDPWTPLSLAQQGFGPLRPRLADGSVEVRKAVREQVRAGADLIKTCSTGAVLASPESDPTLLEWTDDEIESLIEESHRLGRRVAVHAHAAAGIKQALQFGADTIEHGMFLDTEAADMFAERGSYLVPTLAGIRILVDRGHEFGTPRWMIERAKRWIDGHATAFGLALRAGAPIAMGSDCAGMPMYPFKDIPTEFGAMIDAGMSPLEAIGAATHGGAAALGLEHEIGSIAPGMVADLVGLRGDPTANINAISDVMFVMSGGKVVNGPAVSPARALVSA